MIILEGLEPSTFGFEDQCSTIEPQDRMLDWKMRHIQFMYLADMLEV